MSNNLPLYFEVIATALLMSTMGGISGFIAAAITGDRAITSVTGSTVMALAGGRSCRAAVVACERTRQPNSQKQF